MTIYLTENAVFFTPRKQPNKSSEYMYFLKKISPFSFLLPDFSAFKFYMMLTQPCHIYYHLFTDEGASS